MLLRLDPLVGEVIIDGPVSLEAELKRELANRIPVEHRTPTAPADLTIGVGAASGSTDITVDAAGWLAGIDRNVDAADDGNPIGPLAAACLATAEAFKRAFQLVYPARAARLEMQAWSGVFSLFSYDYSDTTPPLADVIRIDATLIGVGGVGAGLIRALAALGPRLAGHLNLIDNDHLTTDNLNRVSFATVAAAKTGAAKVVEAESFLHERCPHLVTNGYRETFDTYKQRTPRRADRRYDVIVTGLDDDQVRWEVQRDLPRILIDGSTGRDMVARVERVEFGRYACLGCTRRPAPRRNDPELGCDAPPDDHAPSLSFLSALPGILAAGEVIKEAMGIGSLRGNIDHVFRYGPNPDLVSRAAIRADCAVGCSRPSRLAQYRGKYPDSPV
jgi:hypothetical protein